MLERFVAAQHGVHERALAELRSGRKQTHWMWFVFPQLAGLGRSETARFYGIASAQEARAYLAHPLLGKRLRDCAEALLPHRGSRPEAILGPIDAIKLKSSMTLFAAVADDPAPFATVLDAFFGGARDAATLNLLDG
ncbi:MAG TPA: DUF1810 domain-containing protein [Allosphingosinicella sp.]|nr:DUF1810 domain-containing protein [Allosphingosinicella sp.]